MGRRDQRETFPGKENLGERERDRPVRTEASSQPRAAPHPPHPHADYRGSNLRT